MSIKNAYKSKAQTTPKLLKEGCIYLITGKKLIQVTQRHD
jgi:hypothetical protein